MPARAGMSLVEIMVSLAIVAMLLTAVGSAFMASSRAIEHNDQFVRAAQAARTSVNVIMADIRKGKVPDAGVSDLVDDEQLEITVDSHGTLVKRTFWKKGTELMMTVDNPLAPETVRLADNIDYLHFSTNGDAVVMIVTVKVGSNQITLSGAAVPRKLMKF